MDPPLERRSPGCVACGDAPTITATSLPTYDYASFTGQPANDAAPVVALLPRKDRVTAAQLAARLAGDPACRPRVLDVRPADQFDMCHLPGGDYNTLLVHAAWHHWVCVSVQHCL